MFYRLRGTLIHTEPGAAVIECGGVGFRCLTTMNTLRALPPLGEEVILYTHLNVREDALDLFGFATEAERACFRTLTAVSGVGAKVGLSILSSIAPEQLAVSIGCGDYRALTRAPGVGPKLAQRIVLELRDRMSKGQLEGAAGRAAEAIAVPAAGTVNHVQEAVAALMVLGYSQAEALMAMEGVHTEGMEAEEIIRQCLKKLAIQ